MSFPRAEDQKPEAGGGRHQPQPGRSWSSPWPSASRRRSPRASSSRRAGGRRQRLAVATSTPARRGPRLRGQNQQGVLCAGIAAFVRPPGEGVPDPGVHALAALAGTTTSWPKPSTASGVDGRRTRRPAQEAGPSSNVPRPCRWRDFADRRSSTVPSRRWPSATRVTVDGTWSRARQSVVERRAAGRRVRVLRRPRSQER